MAKVVALGTASLLPPLPAGSKPAAAAGGAEVATTPPTLEDSRKLLEQNLFNHHFITQDRVQTRHLMSAGQNFEASVAREQAPPPKENKDAVPLWRRLGESPVPLLIIVGKQDRASAAERAELAKQQYPRLDIQVLDRCKHLVQWDCAAEFEALSLRFLAD